MYLQFADWAVPLIFLLALVILLKFRPAILAVSRESYVSVSAGVAILAIVSVSRVYYLNGLYMQVPFLSEPLFYRMVSWIGIITGGVLVANGISNWLPIARLWHENSKTEARYSNFIGKIERLTQVESRADRLISSSLAVISDHFSLSRGIAFRYSRQSGKLHLSGSYPEAHCLPELFAQTTIDTQSWQQLRSGGSVDAGEPFEGLPEVSRHFDLVIPLSFGEQPLGCYLLWSENKSSFSGEDRKYLRLAAEIIERRIDADRQKMRADYYHQLSELHEKIQETISMNRPLLKNLGAVLSAVNLTLKVDFISLQVFGSGPRPVTSLSLGQNGALLVEKGLAMPPVDSPIHRALTTGRPTLHREPELISQSSREEQLTMPLLAAVPLPTGTAMSFVFVLSSRMKKKVGMQTARTLQSLGPIVTRLVEMASPADGKENVERTLLSLCDIQRRACDGDKSRACARAAQFLLRAVNADVIRVIEVEPNSQFLQSLAWATRHRSIESLPQKQLLLRSQLPIHDLVIRTGSLKILKERDSSESMGRNEMNHCFGSAMTSMVIAPVVCESCVVALVTVGRAVETNSRGWTRSDILKIRATANCLSEAMSHHAAVATGLFHDQLHEHHNVPVSELELRSRMKSSLSGIMGSVELMKAHGEPDPQSVNRYLSIIDKSAQRMHSYLESSETLMTKSSSK